MTLAPLPLPLLVDHMFDLVCDTLVSSHHFSATGRVSAILGNGQPQTFTLRRPEQ